MRKSVLFGLTVVGSATVWAQVGASGGRGRAMAVAEVVGDARAGQAFFNGEGKCTTCHSPTGDLKGIASKYNTTVLQARAIMPRGSGATSREDTLASGDSPPTVTVTPASGPAVMGTLVKLSDYIVVLKDAAGVQHSWTRKGDVPKVVVKDPLQAHIDMVPKWTDETMHNMTAYLWTLK